MRHRVKIQALSDQVTASGGTTDLWTTTATVWARVEPMSGREYLREHALHGDTTHRITMRFRSGVTRKHRLLFGARVFDILEASNVDEQRIALVVLAKERDA